MEVLNYAGYISLVLMILQVINELRKIISPIKSNFFIGKYFSWREVDRYISKLADVIKETNTEYGMICGTGRGGGILAALLSYKLDLTPVLVLDRKYAIHHVSGNRGSICIESNITLDSKFNELYSKPILLITPQSDPGITLNKYKEVLENSGFKGHIDKCAIIASERTLDTDLKFCLKKYKPNTTCKKFPWERKSPDLMEQPIHIHT